MPWVQISFAGTPDEAMKARLIQRATAMITEELAVPPSAVNVILTQVPPENWGVAGVPLAVTFKERARLAGHSAMPRTVRSVWTRNGAVKLHALDFPGTSPAIVVVPGITSPAATWCFVVEALDVPNRVIVLDNRGRGWSDAPASGYTREDYADDIQAWCRELTLVSPILLGHSMGARAVATYAARVSDTPVIAIDAPMSGVTRPYPIPLNYYLDGMRTAAAGGMLESFRSTSPGWSDARIKDRLEWLPTCSVGAISESYAHFHDEGFLDVWSGVTGPAMFVRGSRSPVVLADDLPRVRAALPGADVVEIADAGHMIPWDNLDLFVASIKPWIEKHAHARLRSAHV